MQRIANAAYLEGFPFPALLSVAPYCVPGGIRVVSEVHEFRVAGSFALDTREEMGTGCTHPVEFTLGYCRHLRYSGSVCLHQRGAEGRRTPDLRRAKSD